MNHPRWDSVGNHPSSLEIFKYSEGCLDAQDQQDLQEHLVQCWQCRAHLDELRQGINAFIEVHTRVHESDLVAPPGQWRDFERLLACEKASFSSTAHLDALRSFVRPMSAYITTRVTAVLSTFRGIRVLPHATTAMAALVAVVLTFGPFLQPSRMSAGTLLERATNVNRQFRQKRKPGAVQRLQIRKGRISVIRDLSFGPLRKAVVPAAAQTDAALIGVFRQTGLDWDEPLSPERFAHWRASLIRKQDGVTQSEDRFVVTTSDLDGGTIRRASMAIRASDFHTLSQTVYLRGDDEPLTIEEISAELPIDEPPLFATVRRAPPTPESIVVPAPPEATGPTAEQLEISEALVRESLGAVGADITDVPEIERRPDCVVVHVDRLTPERREMLGALVREIPWVTLAENAAESTTPVELSLDESKRVETRPAFARELVVFAGSERLGASYVAGLRAHLDQMLTHGLALNRLAAAYPPDRYSALPATAREHIDLLAARHLNEICSRSQPLRRGLLDLLHSIASQQGTPHSTDLSTPQPGCMQWNEAAPLLERVLRELQAALSRMFSTRNTSASEPVEPAALLHNTIELGTSSVLHPTAVCTIQQ